MKTDALTMFRSLGCRTGQHPQRGFTLIETLLVAVLGTLVIGVMLNVYIQGSDAWQINSVQAELQQNLRSGMAMMVRDFRNCGLQAISNVPADNTWYSTITFRISTGVAGGYISWSNPLQYALSGTQLRRTYNGATATVTYNIKTLQIRRGTATPDIIEVVLTASKKTPRNRTVTASLSFNTKVRN